MIGNIFYILIILNKIKSIIIKNAIIKPIFKYKFFFLIDCGTNCFFSFKPTFSKSIFNNLSIIKGSSISKIIFL